MHRFSLPVIGVVLAALLTGCAPGQARAVRSTPQATLETYFSSAVSRDYSAVYDCYYGRYKKLVTRSEFIQHRGEAAPLLAYRIDSVSASGGKAAVADVTLRFGLPGGSSRARVVHVREELVNESGSWKVRVW